MGKKEEENINKIVLNNQTYDVKDVDDMLSTMMISTNLIDLFLYRIFVTSIMYDVLTHSVEDEMGRKMCIH